MPCTISPLSSLLAVTLSYLWNKILTTCIEPIHRFFALRLPQQTICHTTLEQIRSFLAPQGTSIEQLLCERANANIQLAQALSLTNTFVDGSAKVHADFVQRSRGLLKDVQANGWTKFHEICAEAVRRTLDEYSPLSPWLSPQTPPPPEFGSVAMNTIAFDKFVQIVVLKTVLVGLLNIGKDMDDLDGPSVGRITSNINDLWTLCKSGSPLPSHLSQELHEHLSHLISPSCFSNPIDFVVPTWETMWRVCACTLAYAIKTPEYQIIFRELLAEGEVGEFDSVGSIGISPRSFINEVLRFQPPVKRISRIRAPSTGVNISASAKYGVLGRMRAWIFGTNFAVREVADIRAILRSREIWSHESDCFNPRRFHQMPNCQEVEPVLGLVFGHGKLRCIAASWAPMAAAVICSTILEGLMEKGWEVIPGPTIGGRQGWDGWAIKSGNEG